MKNKTPMDKIAGFYTSLAVIIIGNLLFMGYRWFEVTELFKRHLTSMNMDEVSIMIASKIIAIILVNALVIVAVNAHTLKARKLVEISAFAFSLFLNILFWQAWNGETEVKIFKYVISATFALLDVFFAHLFIEKWAERRGEIEGEDMLKETRKALTELVTKKKKAQKDLKELADEVEAQRILISDTTCPDCGMEFHSTEARNKHWHEHHAKQMIGSHG